MKKYYKRVLTLCFLNIILFYSLAEASEMKFSLLEEAPAFQSHALLGWSWWGDDPAPDPAPDPTAFQMDNILELEGKLNEAILGQEFAISEVVNHLISYQAGINDSNKPIGVLLFIGPTGVGKTQLAKELSKALLGSDIHMTRLDMSEYASHYSIWGLIGPA